jgi:hypothetical protein
MQQYAGVEKGSMQPDCTAGSAVTSDLPTDLCVRCRYALQVAGQ